MITDVPLVVGERPVAERAVGTGARLRRPRRVAAGNRLRARRSSSTTSGLSSSRSTPTRPAGCARTGSASAFELPLDIVEAPFRDLGDPLRAYLRQITAEDTVAVVVMPELVVHGWHRLLHNQRALYLKRLLLFEPHVILSSVPYRLG